MAPGLVEKGQGDQSGAIRNHHFEDGPALLAHRALLGGNHFGDQGDLLAQRDTRNRGELPSAGIAPGVVLQKITHRGIAKRCGRAFWVRSPRIPCSVVSSPTLTLPRYRLGSWPESPLALWNDQNHRWGRGLFAPDGPR